MILALFHDIGLLRCNTEGHLFGAALTPVHEERGVEFTHQYLSQTALAPLADNGNQAYIQHAQQLEPPPIESLLASADLLSQLSDRCYLEKCRDFLFVEFSAFGFAGMADSRFPNRETLLATTPGFVSRIFHQRLEDEFYGEYHLLELHTGGKNPWEKAIQRNQSFLEGILSAHDFARLRRQPKIFN